MKLITAKVKARSAKGASDGQKPLKGVSFTLKGEALKNLKSGKKLYLYVNNDGSLNTTAGLFDKDLSSATYKYADDGLFKDQASHLYTITPNQEASFLKGSRIDPTFLEITRATPSEDEVVVSGFLHNARDARLPFLDRSEKSEFGIGEFKLEDMVALYDGSFFHMALSPAAAEIEKVVEEQKTLFKRHSVEGDDDTEKELENTKRLLKPYAYEIFRIENDLVSFVTKSGKWQTINLAGNRRLDVWDRNRIYNFAEKKGLLEAPEKLREIKHAFYKKPMIERFLLEDYAPILLDEVLYMREKDKKEIESLVEAGAAKKPTDGLDAIPGLREGVEFTPPQSYVISKIKDRDRQLIDVDPGGGKTIQIVADVLNQISLDRVKRPLVIMPNNLVSQFALEINNFSELNPWIINTETIKGWSKEGSKSDRFSKMIEDAREAPVNTLFITSYHFLAASKKLVDNGVVVEKNGRPTYKKVKTFPNAYRLLNELGVDAVYMDEVHTLKNDSNFTKAASAFSKVSQVKGFTGTIMPGNLADVLGPMGIIHSSVLGTADEFVEKYSPTKSINSYHETAPKDIRKELQQFGTPMVRSTAWGTIMPKVHRQYHFVSFNATQQKFYEGLLKNSLEEIKKDEKLARLFKKFNFDLEEEEAIMHPALRARFTPLEIFLNSPGQAANYLGANLTGDDALSPKVDEINQICSAHLNDPNNGKVLVYVQYKEAAKNILKNLAPNLKGQAEYYEGGMVDVLSRFKNPDSNLKILIGVDNTLRMGHNLQVANCIIHADTLWLTGDMRQREARANRLKQTRDVYIHHVVLQDSHELLKNARLLSQEHTISKANSDFEDDSQVPHVEMTLEGMSTFRSIDKIEPLIANQKKIEEFSKKQTEVEKEFYGSHISPPRSYASMALGKKLAVVPSTETFEGNLNDSTYMIEEELSAMKWEESAPKLLSFNFQNWDDQWFLTAFKSVDPNGFTRRLGFMLQPPFYYKEVQSKGGVSAVIEDIEDAGIEILNKDALETGVAKARLLHPNRVGTMKRMEQESRKSVAAAAAKEGIKYQVEFFFASTEGFPYVMSDNIKIGSKEGALLKKKGFKEGVPFWYLPVRRSSLTAFLRKVKESYPDMRIARWDEFTDLAKQIFGLDLKEFDDLGAK